MIWRLSLLVFLSCCIFGPGIVVASVMLAHEQRYRRWYANLEKEKRDALHEMDPEWTK